MKIFLCQNKIYLFCYLKVNFFFNRVNIIDIFISNHIKLLKDKYTHFYITMSAATDHVGFIYKYLIFIGNSILYYLTYICGCMINTINNIKLVC